MRCPGEPTTAKAHSHHTMANGSRLEPISAQLSSTWQRKSTCEIADFFANVVEGVGVGALFERFSNEIRDLKHFFFFHAPSCHGGGADSDATGVEDRGRGIGRANGWTP